MSTPIETTDHVPEATTYPFQHEATFGGAPWNLTGATVTVTFRNPLGTEITRTATVTDAVAGRVQYVTAITDLVRVLTTRPQERWSYAWRIRVGAYDEWSLPIYFYLYRTP